MEIYTSVAERSGEIVDCRCLSLAFEYYNLSYHDVLKLLHNSTQWLDELFGNALISARTINGKRVAKEKMCSASCEFFTANHWLIYSQDSYVVSSIVHNQRTLTAFLKNIRSGINSSSPGMSMDYPEFWEQLFNQESESAASVREKVLSIFQEKKKCCLNYYSIPDLQVLYCASPYAKNNERYYGSFVLNCSALCLGNQLNSMAEYFASFMKSVAMQYVNVNGRVQLQPQGVSLHSPHMRYFGAKARTDGSHVDAMCTKTEWYQTYYLLGSEWFNVVSPLARAHLSDVYPEEDERYTIEKMSSGALIVQAKASIVDYDVDDALPIKKLLYPALYPGSLILPLKKLLFPGTDKFVFDIFPRREWEIIPLLSDEVKIVGSSLVFSHQQ